MLGIWCLRSTPVIFLLTDFFYRMHVSLIETIMKNRDIKLVSILRWCVCVRARAINWRPDEQPIFLGILILR